MNNRVFTRIRVDELLSAVKGKTLGEADSKGLIDAAHKANPVKVQKGIAGDVIEVSVLGCDRDSKPEPDITVDGVKTELKTTGVVTPKSTSTVEYEAKEPLAITGVSPSNIVQETFDTSRFCHKIDHLLFVFYHYCLSETAANSLAYKDFPILGHMFWEVPAKERETLKNDWTLVQNFSRQFSFDNEEERHKLKANLMLVDYASPTQPRFRFKRSFVSTIVKQFLEQEKIEPLATPITKFSDIDNKFHEFTRLYRGKTIGDIADALGLTLSGTDKDTCQRIIVKMFGGEADSINQILEFREIGLVAKTITLNVDGGRTEDTKLFQVDFDEMFRGGVSFSDQDSTGEVSSDNSDYSAMYSYFAEQTFVFIVFKEPYRPAPGKKVPLTECIFE